MRFSVGCVLLAVLADAAAIAAVHFPPSNPAMLDPRDPASLEAPVTDDFRLFHTTDSDPRGVDTAALNGGQDVYAAALDSDTAGTDANGSTNSFPAAGGGGDVLRFLGTFQSSFPSKPTHFSTVLPTVRAYFVSPQSVSFPQGFSPFDSNVHSTKSTDVASFLSGLEAGAKLAFDVKERAAHRQTQRSNIFERLVPTSKTFLAEHNNMKQTRRAKIDFSRMDMEELLATSKDLIAAMNQIQSSNQGESSGEEADSFVQGYGEKPQRTAKRRRSARNEARPEQKQWDNIKNVIRGVKNAVQRVKTAVLGGNNERSSGNERASANERAASGCPGCGISVFPEVADTGASWVPGHTAIETPQNGGVIYPVRVVPGLPYPQDWHLVDSPVQTLAHVSPSSPRDNHLPGLQHAGMNLHQFISAGQKVEEAIRASEEELAELERSFSGFMESSKLV
mmetsp:Transcript_36975/g.72598  ORF Transcript_36975/g.72598 Transcript_36975/m.72598 type:complete len:450 (-) Transcript_36975:400-1749(-)|eukprot:CAMPEP_0175146848 /NCGR_PEP_ID=MMETSP0087-20121206/15625_1 /TAXON_ID=136419 /ORGANISM="Unknown Unknown, Strain D1" /LENGTH=449 /DNA_ID=CAMNT_0016431893 /DNA_START=34 /DNA_END=1383 /DNA_ORIENTATION=-